MSAEKYIAVSIRTLALEEALGFDLFQLEEGKFRLYRHRSIPFKRSDIDKLIEADRDTLYVPKNQRGAFYDHRKKHLKQTLTDPGIPVEEKMSALTESSARILAEVFNSPESATEIKALYEHSESHVVFALLGDESRMVMQSTQAENCPLALSHAISVCNLSILLGIQCGIEDQDELQDIGAGALLHEIGKSAIDAKFYLRKSGGPKITHTRLSNYPEIGKELLEKSNVLRGRALRPVLEHQERLDGSGFPNGLKSKDISIHARIVAICDHFDECMHLAPQSNKTSAFVTLKAMKDSRGKFDTEALCQFIRMLGGVQANESPTPAKPAGSTSVSASGNPSS